MSILSPALVVAMSVLFILTRIHRNMYIFEVPLLFGLKYCRQIEQETIDEVMKNAHVDVTADGDEILPIRLSTIGETFFESAGTEIPYLTSLNYMCSLAVSYVMATVFELALMCNPNIPPLLTTRSSYIGLFTVVYIIYEMWKISLFLSSAKIMCLLVASIAFFIIVCSVALNPAVVQAPGVYHSLFILFRAKLKLDVNASLTLANACTNAFRLALIVFAAFVITCIVIPARRFSLIDFAVRHDFLHGYENGLLQDDEEEEEEVVEVEDEVEQTAQVKEQEKKDEAVQDAQDEKSEISTIDISGNSKDASSSERNSDENKETIQKQHQHQHQHQQQVKSKYRVDEFSVGMKSKAPSIITVIRVILDYLIPLSIILYLITTPRYSEEFYNSSSTSTSSTTSPSSLQPGSMKWWWYWSSSPRAAIISSWRIYLIMAGVIYRVFQIRPRLQYYLNGAIDTFRRFWRVNHHNKQLSARTIVTTIAGTVYYLPMIALAYLGPILIIAIFCGMILMDGDVAPPVCSKRAEFGGIIFPSQVFVTEVVYVLALATLFAHTLFSSLSFAGEWLSEALNVGKHSRSQGELQTGGGPNKTGSEKRREKRIIQQKKLQKQQKQKQKTRK